MKDCHCKPKHCKPCCPKEDKEAYAKVVGSPLSVIKQGQPPVLNPLQVVDLPDNDNTTPVIVPLQFDQVEYDENVTWDPVNFAFVIEQTGVYEFSWGFNGLLVQGDCGTATSRQAACSGVVNVLPSGLPLLEARAGSIPIRLSGLSPVIPLSGSFGYDQMYLTKGSILSVNLLLNGDSQLSNLKYLIFGQVETDAPLLFGSQKLKLTSFNINRIA